MKLIIFEDNKEKFLFPYCINHASFEIKVGLYSNLDRIVSHHKDNDGVYLIVRKEIEKIVKYRYPNFTVNPKIVPKGKYFNARNVCKNDKSGFENIKDDIPLENFSNYIKSMESRENNCLQINFLWDLFKINKQFFLLDIEIYKFDAISSFPSVAKLFETVQKKYNTATLINEKDIIINQDSII